MQKVVIIGAGHNGLTAAFYLAKAGLKPLVIERGPYVGGGAVTGDVHPGFRCPTLSHDVLLHAQIAGDMDLKARGIEYLFSNTEVCAVTEDGPPLVLGRDIEKSAKSVGRRSAKDAGRFVDFRETLGRTAAVLATTFNGPPPDIDHPTGGDLWSLLKAGRAFRGLGQRDEYRLLRCLTMPVADLVREWFETDLLRATIAAPGVSGTMLGPRSAGSALVLLMREAHRTLAAAPLRIRGGPGAMTQAMAAAATAAGAQIRVGQAVEQILVRDEQVIGVTVGGQDIKAGVVVSAVDPKTTFLKLIDPTELTPDLTMKMRHYRASGTVAKVNLALSGLPKFHGVGDGVESLAGRIHVGPELDYLERAFDDAKYGLPSAEPWLDITIPSILDPALAPAGAHVASVYVHYAPYALRGSEWSTSKDSLLSSVLRVLERFAPGVRSLVVAAQVITPAELESQFGFAGGHIFHGELAIDQLFTMRPLLGHARYESPVRGLYLCGAGTHPGGFMTGTSGRLAARRIVKSHS